MNIIKKFKGDVYGRLWPAARSMANILGIEPACKRKKLSAKRKKLRAKWKK
jgi:hypothetical protein